MMTVNVVQLLSGVWLFATPWTAAHQASLSFTISQSLFKFMSIKPVMPSNYFILCHSFSFCLQYLLASGSFPMSQHFASGGQSIGASASASVFPMNIQGCRIDWFDLLAVQGTLKSLYKNHVWKHQFFSALPFYGLALTSIHDYWKNHGFESIDLCQQSDVSAKPSWANLKI